MSALDFVIMHRFHNTMDGEEGNVAPAPLPDPPVYLIDGDCGVDSTDVDAKNVKPRDPTAYRYDAFLCLPTIWSWERAKTLT
jgi:hypothetical protein